jgi:hypothetical protein
VGRENSQRACREHKIVAIRHIDFPGSPAKAYRALRFMILRCSRVDVDCRLFARSPPHLSLADFGEVCSLRAHETLMARLLARPLAARSGARHRIPRGARSSEPQIFHDKFSAEQQSRVSVAGVKFYCE